jgi:hypothetical protein
MLAGLVGEGELRQPGGQRVGMILQRLAAHHEGNQQPEQQDRHGDARHHGPELVRQHAGKGVRPDIVEHVPGDAHEPQHAECAGGNTPSPPTAGIRHMPILPQ